jgi:menaquinone-dependent protoporphyrinogen oxidase
MTARVLVAYGSKYGSTAGIAKAIADSLRGQDLEADVRPAGEVRTIDPYDVVVVGGGLYVGRWHGDAVAFVKRFEGDLTRRPTWLFSSGPTGGTDKAEAEMARVLAEQPAPPGNVARIAMRIGIRDHRTFAGAVTDGMGGFFTRWIPKGDWRDFEAVRAWATEIASAIPVAAPQDPA